MFSNITQIKYAGFGQRFTALMLDLLIVILPSFWISLYISAPIFLDVKTLEAASEDNFEFIYQVNRNFVYFMLIGIAMMALVSTLFTRSRWRATPGKKIVGIYIVSTNGERPNFWNLFGRFTSLPLFILMEQIFQRRETYEKLDGLHKTNPHAKLEDIMQITTGPVSEITSVVIILTICFWYLRIIFKPDKTAVHDLLFDTRVLAK